MAKYINDLGDAYDEEELVQFANEQETTLDDIISRNELKKEGENEDIIVGEEDPKKPKNSGKKKAVVKKGADATAKSTASTSVKPSSVSNKPKSFFEQLFAPSNIPFDEVVRRSEKEKQIAAKKKKDELEKKKKNQFLAEELNENLKASLAKAQNDLFVQMGATPLPVPATKPFLMTSEAWAQQKAQTAKLEKQKKDQENIDKAKVELRFKEAKIRNDKTYQEASTLLKTADVLPTDFSTKLDLEIKGMIDRDGKEYTDFQSGGGEMGTMPGRPVIKNYNSFVNEKNQAIKEFKKANKTATPQQILERAAAIYRNKKSEEQLYSQKWDALEDLESYGEDVQKFFIDYDVNKKTINAGDLATAATQKSYTEKALEYSASQIKDLEKQLKPADYKYTTQEQVDAQNQIINQINAQKKEIGSNIKYYDKLTKKQEVFQNQAVSLEKNIELQKKDWNWWSRTGTKIWNSYVNEFGGGIAGAIAYADDLVMNAVTFGSYGTPAGDYVARVRKENKEDYDSKIPAPRASSTNVEAFMEKATGALIDQIPIILTMAAAPEVYAPEIVGLVTGGVVGTGSKYTQMLQEQKYGIMNEDGEKTLPSYNTTQLFGVPALFGAFEGGSDYVGGRAFKRMRTMFSSATTAEVSQLLLGSEKSILKSSTNFSKELLANYGEQIPTEVMNTVLGNVTDKVLLGKDNVNALDNVEDTIFDTSVVSTLFVTAPHIAGVVYKPFISSSNINKLQENNNKIASILRGIDYEKLSAEEKVIIDSKVQALKDSSTVIINNIVGLVGNTNTDDLLAINNLSKKVIDIKKQGQVINNSTNLSEVQKKDMLSTLNDEYTATNAEYNRYLGAAQRQETAQKKANTFFNRLKLNKDINLGEEFNAKVLVDNSNAKFEYGSGKELVAMAMKDPAYQEKINELADAIENEEVANGGDKYSAEQKLFTKRAVASQIVNSNGLYDGANNTIYVNKDKALSSKLFTTARHEFFHKIGENFANNMGNIGKTLYTFVKDQHIGNTEFNKTSFAKRMDMEFSDAADDITNANEDQANQIAALREQKTEGTITDSQFKYQSNKIKTTFDNIRKDIDNRANEEVSTILAESLESGDIKIDKIHSEKVKFDEDGNVVLNTAKDAFNFIAAYNESFSKTKSSEAISAAVKGKVAGELITEKPTTTKTEGVKKSKAKSELLKEELDTLEDNEGDYDPYDYDQKVASLQAQIKRALDKEKAEIKPEIKKEVSQEDEVKQIIDSEKGSISSDKVQSIYNEKGYDGAYEVIKLFRPITNKIVNKRRDAPGFEEDLLRDEIETSDLGILGMIRKYDPNKGIPLAAYINKYLPVRAIAISRSLLDKDFKKDVTEEKGLIAEETVSEVKEKPKYKNALESNVFEPEVIKTAVGKILTNMRTLKSRIDEPISLNRTVTPLIAEIRDAMGKQLDIDVKTAMGGKKDNEFKNWLLKNKRYMLENMTTTWLMGAKGQGGIPQAIQKQIDGKWTNYPEWVDKKIDRETTSTDLAGRTSGSELVRRLPNAFNNVSDIDYVGQFIGPDGNPIRGRKESGAKAVAEEMTFDIINNDFETNGPILEAFSTNQERQGVEIANNMIVQFVVQSERGNIKRSKAYNNFNDQQKELFNQNINELSTQLNPFLNNIDKDLSIGRVFNNIFGKLLIDDKEAFTEKDINDLVNDFRPWLRQMRDIDKSVGLYLEDENFDFNKFIENIAVANDEIPLSALNMPDVERKLFTANNVNSARDTTKNMFAHWYNTLGPNEAIKMMVYLSGTYKYNAKIGNSIGLDVDESGKVFETGEKGKKSRQIAKNAGDYWDNLVYSSLPGGKSKANEQLLGEIKSNTSKERTTDSASKSYRDKDYEGRKNQSEYYRNLTNKMFEFYFNKENKISNTDKAIMISQMNGSMESAMRKSAILTYEYIDPNGGYTPALRYEHVIPSNKVLASLVKAYAKTNDGKVPKEILDSIWKNYEAALIPIDMDNLFKGINLDSNMNLGWNEDLPSYYRYYNYATFGKENLFPITNVFTGEVIGEEFVNASNAMRAGIENVTKIDSIVKSLKQSKASKGISVFDFDDTVGLTKSNVLYTMPDGSTGKLNGSEFAKEGSKLLDEGATFDFSEFSKVVEGKPGPMVDKMKKMIGKFGPENFYILTARPANSAVPIHQFLESIGINIPLENITGLGNSTAQAKADWMVNKANEGYNDFYFADDHLPNVNAVKDALNVLDVKSKIQQAKAKFSKSISPAFNRIIEENKGTERYKVFSDVVARRRGAKLNKYDFYVPPSAADFELLLYNFMGKGKAGEGHKKFFADSLLKPYSNGSDLMDAARQSIKKDYKALMSEFPEVSKKIENLTPDKDFTYDQAIRVAMWKESGVDVPGLSKTDANKLTNLVNSDAQLTAFKAGLIAMGRQGDGWIEPAEYWDSSTIISDLHGITEGAGRKKFLGEFIENYEQMFGKWEQGSLVGPNMNKIEALYGTNVREALEDSLYRMTNGKNRSYGKDKETSAWSNWVNGSTGAIMFMNTRSAALQLIGAVNFLNLRDNNPIAAAKAFANQPQYWKDFSLIWNSNKMKERRGGLKEDVTAAEIANAAAGSKNKPAAVIAYLLKIGYTPTQLADSFAIASGGAPFYRNRVKTFLKEGKTEIEAEQLAWEDFKKVSDETQQSGDPRDISKQQASGAGRLLLTFQNTAMQQSRIVKKSYLDLKAGRGDAKTHIAKITYYLAIQNTLFAALQQGLFAVAFDDDDEELDPEKDKAKKKTINERLVGIADGVLDTVLRGTGFVGGAVSVLKNMANKYLEEKDKNFKADYAKVMLEGANISPPIGSKLRKLYTGLQQTKFEKDLIKERGWGIMQDGRVHLGSMYGVTGKLVEATTNVPMDRLVNKIENVSQAMNSQNKAWQRVAVGVGFTPYSVGIEDSKGDQEIRAKAKEVRAVEGKIKAKETRQRTKDSIMALPMEERIKLKKEEALKRRANKIAEIKRRQAMNKY